ncbi:MAG TPA: hypothetical protein VGS58_19395 [Candidatus Sulfopaludibacter sp.]|nr:hypothetical protein [Candidatus Sulfopaludibacter sp.]
MKMLRVLEAVAFAALLTLPAAAATKAAAREHKAPARTAKAARHAWPAEDITGTIASVDPARHLVIVKTSDGVPFDMTVGRSTRIEAGTQTVKLDDLNSDVNKSVSVKFVPERRGDVARTIQITG